MNNPYPGDPVVRKVGLFVLLIGIIALMIFGPKPSHGSPAGKTGYFQKVFGQRSGCFIMVDARTGAILVQNDPQQCEKRLPPCGTFRYPNYLIGLAEEKLDLAQRYRYEGELDVLHEYERETGVRDAFHGAFRWFQTELAERIGREGFDRWLGRLRYGNADASGNIDTFWLGQAQLGTLTISAREQAEFLARLYTGTLDAPKEAQENLRRIAEIARGDGFSLGGKIGTCRSSTGDIASTSWFVGAVTRGEDIRTFAFVMNSRIGESGREAREIGMRILDDYGLFR